MNVLYYSPHRKPDWEKRGLEYLNMHDLVREREIIVICSPTNTIVSREAEFNAIHPGSILVQASGGTPFDKEAFYSWIKTEENFAIFELSAGEENYLDYKDLPGVIFPRTVAGDTHESNERRSKRAVKNSREYLTGT